MVNVALKPPPGPIGARSAAAPSVTDTLPGGTRPFDPIVPEDPPSVLLGRPYAYALAVGGQRGVEELIQNLMAEIDLNLALVGAHSIGDLDRTWLTRV